MNYFKDLAEKLDELFPKGKCQERGQALMLNAYANLLRKQELEEILTELYRIRASIPLTQGKWAREQMKVLIGELEEVGK